VASRKAGGTKRPKGKLQIGRWVSLLFGGVVLLFIGMLIGLQAAGYHPPVTASTRPAEQRIVVDQPARVVEREAVLPRNAVIQPPPVVRPEPPAVPSIVPPPVAAESPGHELAFDDELDSIEIASAKAPQPVVPPIPSLPQRAVAAVPVPAPAPAQPIQERPPVQDRPTVQERVARPVPAPVVPASLALPGSSAGWRKFALAPPSTEGKPIIAVVIDDLGVDRKRSERVLTLPAPLTTAFMSYAKDLPRITAAARGRGHELMLHMPMEPMGASNDAGPAGEVLTVGLPAAEIRRRVAEGLGRFDGMIGLNNHMGSKFTSDPAGMKIVMEELAKRGLMFLDSVTTNHSAGLDEARKRGVAALARDVFIDNEETFDAVTAQLRKAEAVARKQGYAIAIGHPHDATIEALAAWLPTLKDKGLVQVPVSAILRRQHPSG
jgi:polysaccharide deacetylase 2 family uncharacterized protein YibQ